MPEWGEVVVSDDAKKDSGQFQRVPLFHNTLSELPAPLLTGHENILHTAARH